MGRVLSQKAVRKRGTTVEAVYIASIEVYHGSFCRSKLIYRNITTILAIT